MKVLHVLYQSLPQVSGSSIRSRDLLMTQKEIGIQVVAITSPFQDTVESNEEDILHGVRYIRSSKRKSNPILGQKKSFLLRVVRLFSIFQFTLKLYKTVKKEKPEILHAHAMFYCGIPAIIIGKIKKIPVVYEFRSLWMFQEVSDKNKKEVSLLEKLILKIEILVLKKANYAVFLNESLLNFFIENSHSFPNSTVINNAVNTELINKYKKGSKPLKREEPVFGYIGTLTYYEGLELLIESFQELFDEGVKNKLLIYGEGVGKGSVLKTIGKRPDIDTISYNGSIGPDQVHKAFEKIDVIVNPRISADLTNSVTPLKPLEAYAYEKLVIGSDVRGILALVENNRTGFVFKAGDKTSLKKQIKKVIKLPIDRKEAIIKNALNFVEENKSWNKNASIYKEIYTSLLKK